MEKNFDDQARLDDIDAHEGKLKIEHRVRMVATLPGPNEQAIKNGIGRIEAFMTDGDIIIIVQPAVKNNPSGKVFADLVIMMEDRFCL